MIESRDCDKTIGIMTAIIDRVFLPTLDDLLMNDLGDDQYYVLNKAFTRLDRALDLLDNTRSKG